MSKTSFLSGIFVFCSAWMLLMNSCDPSRVFDENKAIENNAWDMNNKLVFEIEIPDPSISYNVYLNVRNAGWYPFSNLFVFINTQLPDGKLTRDTAECVLADKDGRWLGDGLGDIWDNRILFRKNFKFSQGGKYVFTLEHGMRVNPLPGIADAGIRIEKVK